MNDRFQRLLGRTEPSELDLRDWSAERRDLKSRYGELFDEVSAILFRLDPIGINFDNNTDEYESEAGTIIPRLRTAESVEDTRWIIEEEFLRWFSDRVPGPTDRYAAAAEEIWGLWVRTQPQRP